MVARVLQAAIVGPVLLVVPRTLAALLVGQHELQVRPRQLGRLGLGLCLFELGLVAFKARPFYWAELQLLGNDMGYSRVRL